MAFTEAVVHDLDPPAALAILARLAEEIVIAAQVDQSSEKDQTSCVVWVIHLACDSTCTRARGQGGLERVHPTCCAMCARAVESCLSQRAALVMHLDEEPRQCLGRVCLNLRDRT